MISSRIPRDDRLERRALLRWWTAHTIALAAGWVLAFLEPRALPFGAAFAVAAAVVGTRRSANPHARAVIRHALLAVLAFAYPLFLGGRVLPWAAAAAHLGLIALAWLPSFAGRARLLLPQALAGSLGVGITAAAALFFFPAAWRSVAVATVVGAWVLLAVHVPTPRGILPSPAVSAAILAVSEGIVILRYLPTHWAVNGAVLALALAAVIEQRRAPRVALAGLLVAVFLFGAVQ